MGLEPILRLAVGAKVMLRQNLWVEAGLTNGSLGTLKGFLFDPNSETSRPPSIPTAVCVEFPSYTGPPWDNRQPHVIPIPPTEATWMSKGQIYSRTQIPLMLAHAVTIHKSQGWTRDRIKVDLGPREISGGLSFVAISRTKSLAGLMIHPQDITTFNLSRLLAINRTKHQEHRRYIDEYMKKLQQRTLQGLQ